MVRGRSPNLSLPETRTLLHQRKYRARRAAQMDELERANATLLEENLKLRREVESLRAEQAASGSGAGLRLDEREKFVLEASDRLSWVLQNLHRISGVQKDSASNGVSASPLLAGPQSQAFQHTLSSTQLPTRQSSYSYTSTSTAITPVSDIRSSHLHHTVHSDASDKPIHKPSPTSSSNITCERIASTLESDTPAAADAALPSSAMDAVLSQYPLDETKCCLGMIECSTAE